MLDMGTRDRITLIITVTLCAFLILSLFGTFALEWVGRDSGTIWGRIFDLVNVLAGAVVGFIAGQTFASATSGGESADSGTAGSNQDEDGEAERGE